MKIMKLNYGLTANDLKNIAKLLELAKDTFSNHGCNDFNIENTPENQQIVKELYSDSADFEFVTETICVMDWMLMDYYAEKLKSEIK